MTKSVFRTDRAALRSPVITPQGFYRADAHVARVGIYEYRNDDGSIRRELRPYEEVSDPESLASYDAAPLVVNHPRRADGSPDDVTAENVRRLKVGTVVGVARMDDDHVATTIQVEDAHTIKRSKSGMQELSPGYYVRLDETAGFDQRYAYPSNPLGQYHAVQRHIRVNHVALTDSARGGRTTRLRIDSADSLRADGDVDLTSIEKGHQHSIETEPSRPGWDGAMPSRNSGCTSWAVSEGADCGHSHDWVRGPDGKITIAMSDGHTHTIIEDDAPYAPSANGMPVARGDGQIDQPRGVPDSGRMPPSPNGAPPPDPAEQIRLLTIRADEADRTSGERAAALEQTRRDADGVRAELATARERVATLETQLAAGSSVVETQAVQEQRQRADAAERELSMLRAQQPLIVRRRASLVAKANAVLGGTFRCDALTEREILVAGIRHLRPKEPTGPEVSDEYLAKRFDSLVDDRTSYGASLGRASETLQVRRVDAAPTPVQPAQVPWADRWTLGAGQFATRKDS